MGEALDTGATFSTVTEMQVEAEKAQQTYEEIESLEDSHIVSFPKLDKEKEALRRKTQDGWLNEGLLDSWMGKDANRLWESVVRYVYKKRGLKFEITGNESISR